MLSLKKYIVCSVDTVINNAGVLAIALIIVIEFTCRPILTSKFFSHEVDRTLYQLEKKGRNQNIVVIGDSVGHGIFTGWRFDQGTIATLACNQATETAGQYFFLKRFFKNNAFPGAILSCDRTPFSGNLEQNLTENYIQRCFTNWDEIIELFLVKNDPVFTIKMIAYRFFSTYKYRLHLQKSVGFSNSNIYTGISEGVVSANQSFGIIQLFSKHFRNNSEESISSYFVDKILQFAAMHKIPFYYLPPPANDDSIDAQALISSTINDLKPYTSKFDSILVLSKLYEPYPSRYFSDGVHLNSDGLNKYRSNMQPIVDGILATAKQRQRDNISQAFNQGLLIFTSFGQTDLLSWSIINDSLMEKEKDGVAVSSLVGDPAILLPRVNSRSTSREGKIIVKISFHSSRKTKARLYYTKNSNLEFREDQSVSHRVGIGQNILYFIMPEKFRGGSLRFDPGETNDTYLVTGAEARLVQSTLLDHYAKFVQPQ